MKNFFLGKLLPLFIFALVNALFMLLDLGDATHAAAPVLGVLAASHLAQAITKAVALAGASGKIPNWAVLRQTFLYTGPQTLITFNFGAGNQATPTPGAGDSFITQNDAFAPIGYRVRVGKRSTATGELWRGYDALFPDAKIFTTDAELQALEAMYNSSFADVMVSNTQQAKRLPLFQYSRQQNPFAVSDSQAADFIPYGKATTLNTQAVEYTTNDQDFAAGWCPAQFAFDPAQPRIGDLFTIMGSDSYQLNVTLPASLPFQSANASLVNVVVLEACGVLIPNASPAMLRPGSIAN